MKKIIVLLLSVFIVIIPIFGQNPLENAVVSYQTEGLQLMIKIGGMRLSLVRNVDINPYGSLKKINLNLKVRHQTFLLGVKSLKNCLMKNCFDY